MLANLMKMLGVSSDQAVEPEVAYVCVPDDCSALYPKRKHFCDADGYCETPSQYCCH